MAKKIARIGIIIVAVVMIIVAFAGVVGNQGERTNRVIDTVNLEYTDKYMTEEVIRAWYGQVGLTNVEEFGTNNGKVSAIIHYKNTTHSNITLAPSDLGTFMDSGFDYTIYGADNKRVVYEPGDTAEFRVYINRKEGLDGLVYLISEPESGGLGGLDTSGANSGTVYQASIDLNMLNPDIEEKIAMYGISPRYTEEEKEDSIGRDENHVALINTIESLLISDNADAKAAEAEQERIEQLELEREQALQYLNSL